MALDLTRVVMFAMFQASTKLCHCGWVGNEIPPGQCLRGASAADSIDSSGKMENSAARVSRIVFGPESRSRVSTSAFGADGAGEAAAEVRVVGSAVAMPITSLGRHAAGAR